MGPGYKATKVNACIPPSIVLPIQQVKFNCDVFPQ